MDQKVAGSSPVIPTHNRLLRIGMQLQRLLLKIERLYEAVGGATESDLSKFPPTLEVVGNWVTVRQDFNQGLNQAQLQNKAFQVIRSIADLKDHLRATGRRLGFDPEEVERTIDGCSSLQLMIDLANFDKHGSHGRPRDQRSGKSPRLVNVHCALQITVRGDELGAAGSSGIRMTPRGAIPFGGGKSAIVITGAIVDASGAKLALLQFAQASAIEAWESLFARFGIDISSVAR